MPRGEPPDQKRRRLASEFSMTTPRKLAEPVQTSFQEKQYSKALDAQGRKDSRIFPKFNKANSLRRRANARNVSTSLLPCGGITYLINSFDYPNLLCLNSPPTQHYSHYTRYLSEIPEVAKRIACLVSLIECQIRS